MSVLRRRKKQGIEGFKGFVKTLETAPHDKQRDILEAAILDDPIYTDYAHRNILTIQKALDLDDEELDFLMNEIPNAAKVFCQALYQMEKEEKIFLEKIADGHKRIYMDEKEYQKEIKEGIKESSQHMIFEKIRAFQESGNITSIKWIIPGQDVLEEKKISLSSGVWDMHYEDGKVSARGELVNYERQGKWSHFYPSGELLAVGDYHKGKKEGPWFFFHHDGSKMAEGHFTEDKKVGGWSLWDLEGTETKKQYG